ncbi:hypothetical protein [Nocardia asteroides]|uniref:hypothetical protein n=1 Tax=Nocardia asteroides TaxID=1824 RepID=UPI001E64BE73|nr:hypothetical protein [Nocardia asteroides]UGT64428.1 hypothetical protein LTT61_14555 [Nocardia asteroides]
MSSLLPRANAQLSPNIPDGFTRSEGRSLQRLQNKEVARGLVAATRVQAAGIVAALGLQTTAMLSREANFQADGDPAAAARLGYIVEQYAAFVGSEVSRFHR